MSGTFEVASVSTDFKRKTASVSLKSAVRGVHSQISVYGIPFDPPGLQTEDELEAMALAAAREVLASGIKALGG